MATAKTAAKKPAAKKVTKEVAKKEKSTVVKSTYGAGAFRRWKKNGLVSEDGKQVNINGTTYDISKDGKKYTLTAK